MTAHFRTAQSETSLSLSVTHSYLATFTELHRWPFLAAVYPAAPQRGQRALRNLSMVTWAILCRYPLPITAGGSS